MVGPACSLHGHLLYLQQMSLGWGEGPTTLSAPEFLRGLRDHLTLSIRAQFKLTLLPLVISIILAFLSFEFNSIFQNCMFRTV